MEKRQKVQQLQQHEQIPVPLPNNSEKNFNNMESSDIQVAYQEKKEPSDSHAELRAMHAQLDEVMKPLAAPAKPDLRKAKDGAVASSPADW